MIQPSLFPGLPDLIEGELPFIGPRSVPPPWFVGGTPTQRARAVLGLHPLGQPLAGNGHTCGECAHLRIKPLGKDYFKCFIQRPEGCAATDVRRKWPACVLWQERAS